jgi:PPOX class probable F420-dependent enzyme
MTTMNVWAQFEKQQFLNLETLRKSGLAVATPVWFLKEGDTLYIRTPASSGKVKRVRNNQRVRVAVCDRRGNLSSEWIKGKAGFADAREAERINKLLNDKYGAFKRIFDFMAGFRKVQYAVIAVQSGE